MTHEVTKAAKGQLATSSAQAFSAILARFDLTAVKSLENAVALSTPTIGEICRQIEGNAPIRSYIAGHIVSLRDFVNLKGAMTDEQTMTTASFIVDDFPNLTIADVSLIFRRAKLGQYGEFYGRLDGQMILTWFSKFFDERCAYFAEKSIREATSLIGYNRVTDERVNIFVQKLLKK